jgi:predicted membrane chloride channel (bestrophin family)
MFLEDPQVDKKEARRLLGEMMIAVKRISRDVMVVVSTEETRDYEDIFEQFKNRLELCGNATLVVNAISKYRSRKFSLPEKALKMVKVE